MCVSVPTHSPPPPPPPTDSIREGYKQLRALVMAYGDISPESPLSMSQITVTTHPSSQSSSQQTTPTPLHNSETTTVEFGFYIFV